MSLIQGLLFCLIVFCATMVQAMAGFGSALVALPFLALVVGLKVGVPSLGVLALVVSSCVAVRNRRHVDWRVWATITVFVGVTMPIGMLLFGRLPERALRVLFGVFIIGVSVHRLLSRNRPEPTGGAASAGTRALLLAGGIIHGAFASGGPFIVLFAARALPDKQRFRATLAVFWTVASCLLVVGWALSGAFRTPMVAQGFLVGAPFMLLGMWVGDRLHHRVDQERFKLVIYAVLLIGGVATILGAL